MAAHFAGERRADLFHLLLDEGVSRLPHHRLESGLLEHLRQHFGAFHIEDDGFPLPQAAHEIATEQDEQLIAEHRLPALIDRANAVAVAIEGDAELRLLLLHGRLEVVEVLEHRGIGMVMRKRPVGLREQRHNAGTQLPQCLDGDETGHAIATIDDDLEAPGERRIPLHDRFAVGGEQVAVRLHGAAGFRRHLAGVDHLIEALDVVAEHGVMREHHLEAVELRRIVRAGDLDAAVHRQCFGRKVERGRGLEIEVELERLGRGQAHCRPSAAGSSHCCFTRSSH